MSANRSSLRNPAVIAVVVVALGAVVVLNLRTFAPKQGARGRAAAGQFGQPALPSDLDAVVRDAALGLAAPADSVAEIAADRIVLGRDPFASGAKVTATSAPTRRTSTRRAPRSSLTCSAVLLGGERPVALIDGKAYGPGDVIRGHEVLSVDTEGVRLREPAGGELRLAIDTGESGDSYHVVTRTQTREDRGLTRLDSKSDTERTNR